MVNKKLLIQIGLMLLPAFVLSYASVFVSSSVTRNVLLLGATLFGAFATSYVFGYLRGTLSAYKKHEKQTREHQKNRDEEIKKMYNREEK